MTKNRPFIENVPQQLIEKIALAILILSHALAVFFSFGFHHPDEHYQILEWANYFLGLATDGARTLPWEYHDQIRPWLQPLLHVGVMKILLGADIYNSVWAAHLFRALYATANIVGIIFIWRGLKEKFSLNVYALLAVSMIWFFPYLHVRTSSENLSGIFLTFAFYLLVFRERWFWSGLLFGFAFLARYQIALGLIGLVGFGAYSCFRKPSRVHGWFRLSLGFISALMFGLFCDRIGYGNWVFTPYRYFDFNLIQGIAAKYSPQPWYQYLVWIVELNPLVSLPLLGGFIYYFKTRKLEPIGIFVFSFIFFHIFISNKEYRFLFPILNLVPFLAILAFEKFFRLPLKPGLWVLWIAFNLVAFAASTLRGASPDQLWAIETANLHAKPGEVWLSSHDYNHAHLFEFYHLPRHELRTFSNSETLIELLKNYPEAKVMIKGKWDDGLLQPMLEILAERKYRVTTSVLPEWFFDLRFRFKAIERVSYQALFVPPRPPE